MARKGNQWKGRLRQVLYFITSNCAFTRSSPLSHRRLSAMVAASMSSLKKRRALSVERRERAPGCPRSRTSRRRSFFFYPRPDSMDILLSRKEQSGSLSRHHKPP
jgi:hypothetical protein